MSLLEKEHHSPRQLDCWMWPPLQGCCKALMAVTEEPGMLESTRWRAEYRPHLA